MTACNVTLVDSSSSSALRAKIDALVSRNLPEFMMWASPGNWRWHRLYEEYPESQLALVDRDGTVIAALNSLPIAWGGVREPLPDGYDDVLERFTGRATSAVRNATCLLSISIQKDHRKQRLPAMLIAEAKRRALSAGHHTVVSPIRPTRKSEYPLVPMSDYIERKNDAGESFDPWLRTHLKMGATVLGVADRSVVIVQPVSRWQGLVGQALGNPGYYCIPGALAPIHVDHSGMGTYIEPNVWISYSLA